MKKVISVLLVFVFVFLMFACKKNNDTSTEVTHEEPVAETTTEPTTQAEIEDTLAIYEIDSGKELCLYRNEKFYNLSGEISTLNFEEFQMGYKESRYNPKYFIYFTPENTDFKMAFGDFPLIEIQPEDSIRGYGKTKINLYKAKFIGYGITAENFSSEHTNSSDFSKYTIENVRIYYNEKKFTNWFFREKEAINIKDMSGNIVNEYYDLPYNEEYIVSWYDNTEYKELYLTANNPCYKKSDDLSYSIEGILTKNGYATFDLSDIPSGLYFIDTDDSTEGTFIKIP